MKFYVPRLLFLDSDLSKSAMALTNQMLESCLKNSCQIMMCSIYYLLGFRNKRLFEYHFKKDKWDETRFKYFPNWPLEDRPKFTFYTSEEARWCRKCFNHYRYVLKYFGCMLDEFAFRNGKEHHLSEMYGFLQSLPMELALRHGYRLATLKDKAKMQLPWKNLSPKYRRKDIIAGYRLYYASLLDSLFPSPLEAFIGTRRDVPEFLVEKMRSAIA